MWPEIHVEPVQPPLAWMARKQHKTHFRNRYECESQPKTNTPLFYDGSAEAQAILVMAGDIEMDYRGYAILQRSLDYLKGKDLLGTSSVHDYVMEEFFDEELKDLVSFTFPNKPCVPTKVAVFDNSEDYPAYSIQNQDPLDQIVPLEEECDCAKGTFCIVHGEPKEKQ